MGRVTVMTPNYTPPTSYVALMSFKKASCTRAAVTIAKCRGPSTTLAKEETDKSKALPRASNSIMTPKANAMKKTILKLLKNKPTTRTLLKLLKQLRIIKKLAVTLKTYNSDEDSF
jgi:hypothetical protein